MLSHAFDKLRVLLDLESQKIIFKNTVKRLVKLQFDFLKFCVFKKALPCLRFEKTDFLFSQIAISNDSFSVIWFKIVLFVYESVISNAL
jgi:hypothetical protein